MTIFAQSDLTTLISKGNIVSRPYGEIRLMSYAGINCHA